MTLQTVNTFLGMYMLAGLGVSMMLESLQTLHYTKGLI